MLLEGRSLSLALAELRGRDAALPVRALATAQNMAYGTLRRAGRLRFFLNTLTGRPPQPTELLGHLLVGLHELDSEAAPAYAVVNETVSLAAAAFPRARGFVNAVLRNFQRRRGELELAADENPEARWNLPTWWLARLQQEYPDRWQALVTAQDGHPPMTLRVNRRHGAIGAYLQALRERGMACRQTGPTAVTLDQPVPVSELPGFREGLVSVQDLGAQAAAPLLDAAPGMRVLDACAAPGGKTCHLLELVDLDLIALDSHAGRMERVRENLDRLGLAAHLQVADAGQPRAWWDGKPFDRILLDAPCTASGVVRRHPDGKWLKRADDLQQLVREQADLMNALWPLLKPGGKMLYATCSLFRAENADQVAAFLRRHPDARTEPLALDDAPGGQLLPGPDKDGFFYARFLKT